MINVLISKLKMVSALMQLVPGLPSTLEEFSIPKDDQNHIGDGATKLFHKAIEEYLRMLTVQSEIRSPSMAKALIDRCWEELNTSHWAEVPDVWRILYSYAALCCASFHLNAHLISTDLYVKAVKDALYHCDMGLIMGKPVFGGVLTRLATCCHQKLTACLEKDTSDPASKDVEPVTCEGSISRLDLCPPISDPVPRLRCPSVERFVREVFGQRPAVLTDCVSHWPALQWTLASLERTAGHRTVPVELGGRYTDAGWSQRLMTLGEFIQQHVRQPAAGAPTGYLAQYELFQQIPELGADVPTPEYCYVGDSDAVHTNIWLGPAGTVSPLHHDPKHNCLVQVLGSKFVQVFSPEETPRLYPHEAEMLHNTSRVDAERPDLERFPDFAAARHQELVLGPGDLLYMPPRWWHYVRSLSVSCSVSFWFE